MGKKGSSVKNGERKLKSINDSAGNVTVVSSSSIDGDVDGTIIGEAGYPSMVHNKVTCDNVTGLFGVSLASIKDINDLTRRMEVGACEDVLGGLDKDEWNAIMDVIIALCDKFLAATSDNEYSPKDITNDGPTHSASEWNIDTPLGTSPKLIKSLLEKFSGDMSNLSDDSFGMEQPANVDISSVPNPNMPIVQSVSIQKLVSYVGTTGALSTIPKKGRANFRPLESEKMKGLEDGLKNGSWMIRNSPLILKKWMINTRLFKEELTRIPVWVKLHDVPIQVFSKDGISLIATQIGKPVILDSFTSSMCTNYWGQGSFARCLIEVRANATLKDIVTMGIPLPDGEGFTKETIQVEYEWKPPCCDHCKIFGHVYDQCPKNVTSSTINNRSGAAAGKATWQPIKKKVSYEPKAHGILPKNGAPKVSNYVKDDPSKKLPATMGGLHIPTSKPSVPTSNPYDVLDDMESVEEAEVVCDETVILKDARMRACPSMAPDGSNTRLSCLCHVGIISLFLLSIVGCDRLKPKVLVGDGGCWLLSGGGGGALVVSMATGGGSG
ncbi:zinc knuckle CX2CX4HX4C containing protein [Tanacetum coccineum]